MKSVNNSDDLYIPEPPQAYLIAGPKRLPKAYRRALETLPVPATPLEPASHTETTGATVLVAVTDSHGLGELASMADAAAPGQPVVALYTGRRLSLAALCTKVGATDVICLDEVPPEALGDALSALAQKNELPWCAAALEMLHVGVAVRTRDGEFRYRNPVHARVAPETLSDYPEDPPGPQNMAQVTDIGSGRVYLLTQVPLSTADPDLMLEVLEEITGRHTDQGEISRQRDVLMQHARALARANRELARLDRAKSEFIALAAHEIRTPLTAIRTAVHLLEREIGDTSDHADRFLDMASRNIRRLSSLAEDLLDFTKLETRQLTPAFESVNPATCIHNAVQGHQADAAEAGIRVNVLLPGTLPVMQADDARLTQIITNLVGNAVKRTPSGGAVQVEAEQLADWREVELTDGPLPAPALPDDPEGWLEVRVEDAGPVVPDDLTVELFNSFSPGEGEISHDCREFGLGLAICRRIAETHGGVVWAESAGDAGIRLSLRLPILSADNARLLAGSEAIRRFHQKQAEPALVVIEAENDATFARAAKTCLRSSRPGWLFVESETDRRIVGVLEGGNEGATALLERVARKQLSRQKGGQPIRGGWTLPDPAETFREALARARATVGVLEPRPGGKIKAGG